MGDDASTYDEAVASVGNGVPEAVAAAAIVAKMTLEEKLWCLDGDLPFWAGLDDLKDGGYHKRPDEEMLALWDVAVAETRGTIEGPWK